MTQHHYTPTELRGMMTDPYCDYMTDSELSAEFDRRVGDTPSMESAQSHKTVGGAFEEACPGLVVDKRLAKLVENYAYQFANKNQDHIAFFGGTLLGVHVVRFRPEDRTRWFDEVLECDDLALEDEIMKNPYMVEGRHVSTDVMNLSCFWLCHKFFTSNRLSQSEKEEAMMNTMMVLQYKYITSLMAHYFPYQADEQIAQATYARLSKKFGLKIHGSWRALLIQRSKDILIRGGLHYKTYTEFRDDNAIVKMVNDTQGRVRDIVKNIRDVFSEVQKDPKGLIRADSSTSVNMDGEVQVKSLKRSYTTYRRYISDVITDKRSFIRDELVHIVSTVMPAAPKSLFEEALTYTSLNAGIRGDKDVAILLDNTLTHAFDYISSNRDVIGNVNDIAGMLMKFRGLYTSSRTQDPMVLVMRETAERIVKRSVRSKNPAVVAAIRTSMLMYILVRTLTMHHYGK